MVIPGPSSSITQLQTFMAHAARQDNRLDFSLTMTSVTGTVAMEEPADQPATVEDVKQEFYNYLNSLPLSPGLSRAAISVDISDAAFEKMLGDPEYKQKMMDLCKRDLCDPQWGNPMSPSAIVINIDADVEDEYPCHSYNHPSLSDKADREGDFWSKRTEKQKEARKAREAALEKRDLMAFLQERADQRKQFAEGGSFKDAFGTPSYLTNASHPVSSEYVIS